MTFKLLPYHSIENRSIELFNKYAQDERTSKLEWYVTEKVQGTHLALYANEATEDFRATDANVWLAEADHYCGWKQHAADNRKWIMALSAAVKCPVAVYGVMSGGKYGNLSSEDSFNTKVQYAPCTDFFVHDIFMFNNGLMSLMHMERIAKQYDVTVCPTLYKGTFSKAFNYPANKLSLVPFLYGCEVNYSNEMYGIVVRPVHSLLTSNNLKHIITRAYNPKYQSRALTIVRHAVVVDRELVTNIAEDMGESAYLAAVMDWTIAGIGGVTINDLALVCGKYVKNVIDNIEDKSYNDLNEESQKAVRKLLFRMAYKSLLDEIKTGEAA
jgi:hypothetical protein